MYVFLFVLGMIDLFFFFPSGISVSGTTTVLKPMLHVLFVFALLSMSFRACIFE